MSVASSSCLVLLLLLSSSSSSSPLLLLPAGPQPRPSTPSVPCRTSTTTITAQCSLPDLNREYTRPDPPSVPCRTSTTTIPAQCSLPDLNHDHPRPVFPGTSTTTITAQCAGPQPRPSTPSVPCRTSTATSRSQWALPDLNGKNVRKDVRWNVRRYAR